MAVFTCGDPESCLFGDLSKTGICNVLGIAEWIGEAAWECESAQVVGFCVVEWSLE